MSCMSKPSYNSEICAVCFSRRSPTPTSPTKGPASPSPPRKATPIPQQVAPPLNFPATSPALKSLHTSTTKTVSVGQTPPTSSTAHDKPQQLPLNKTTSLPIQKPLVPSIVRTSPPPQPKPLQTTDPKASPPSQGPLQNADPGSLAQPSDIRLSTTSVDDSDLLDSGDESIVASSIVTQDSSVYGPSSGTSPQMQRKKTKLGRGLRAALKVLNDSIGKPVRSGQQLTNALNIIQRDWFKVHGPRISTILSLVFPWNNLITHTKLTGLCRNILIVVATTS